VTGINTDVIQGTTLVRDVSVARRMSWASKREITSLAQFAGSDDYARCPSSRPTAPYSITNKGLRIEILLCHSEEVESSRPNFLTVLECQVGESYLSRLAIYLRRISAEEDQYARIRPWDIEHYPPGMTPAGTWKTIYVRQKCNFQTPFSYSRR
jgi:hypothetical protein